MATVEPDNEKQAAIVRPILKTKDAVSELDSFETMKSRLLVTSDYQRISGKNFIKKSGWRKLALVFNISDQVMDSVRAVRVDGSFVWSFRVRAIAPNGRFTEAVASCDSRERKFAHIEHDVQAIAQTRSKSRAISDLIGAGEVSAEEMMGDQNPSSKEFDADLSDDEKQRALSLLHSAKDIFQGHVVEKKSISSAPMPAEGTTKRFEFVLDRAPFPVDEEAIPFSRFFLGKICKSMIERNPNCYFELEKDAQERVCAIVWHNLDDAQEKEIARTLYWSLKKIAERKAIEAA